MITVQEVKYHSSLKTKDGERLIENTPSSATTELLYCLYYPTEGLRAKLYTVIKTCFITRKINLRLKMY